MVVAVVPVPPRAFAEHWLAPGATRGLTLQRRRQLLCLTAASGVVANLEVAMEASGCLLTHEILEAAAAAGQLAFCQFCSQRSCSPGCGRVESFSSALSCAAKAGHRHVCEWLLEAEPRAWSWGAVAAAAVGGRVGLVERLLPRAEDWADPA
ncbi:hypothetical protein GPECTOR_23g67 [Gonium pectorale]|uniref:Uncharacterized protein n=1 Tax=Gonium pectorale TaxID=33097 RepID=A0A150GH78_GONPE|nr:hypothetical protein GPECTOR_23g67 [Gonium pectorale]|eukprot:KXZ49139.1 hypothetical protein GPECTOR_23g67 [Gonium pectorale]